MEINNKELQKEDFYPQITSSSIPAVSSASNVEQSRAIAETQAAMVVAQGRPRDEFTAFSKIIKACERQSLAATAMYAYPRGGQMVEGPSIRLAEVMARAWGNITYGLREISRGDGESEIEAFAWDLESNTRVTRQFVLRHIRDKRGGGQKLTEERDVYELTANMGQRRVRACLLELIPGDIVEEAVKKCKSTLAGGDGTPIEDRIRVMVVSFDSLGVSKVMLEEYLQHKVTAIVPAQLVKLQQIYSSINTGVADRSEFFNINAESGKDKLNEQFSGSSTSPENTKAPNQKKKAPEKQESVNQTQSTVSYTSKIGANEKGVADPDFPAPGLQLEARKCKDTLTLDRWRSNSFTRFERELSDEDLGVFIDWVTLLYKEWKEKEEAAIVGESSLEINV